MGLNCKGMSATARRELAIQLLRCHLQISNRSPLPACTSADTTVCTSEAFMSETQFALFTHFLNAAETYCFWLSAGAL